MARLSSGNSENRSSPTARPVYRVRSRSNSELFTESVIVFTLKTAWARLTTPRALENYYAVLRQLIGLILLTLATIATGILWFARQCWGGAVALLHAGRHGASEFGRGLGSLNRGVARGVGRGVEGMNRGARSVRQGVGTVRRGAGRAGRAMGSGVGVVGRSVGSGLNQSVTGIGHGVSGVGRGVDEVKGGIGEAGVEVWKDVRRLGVGLKWMAVGTARVLRCLARVARLGRALEPALGFARRYSQQLMQASLRVPAAVFRGMRRHRFVPASIALSCVLLLVGPVLADMAATLAQGARVRIAALSESSPPSSAVPAISIPEISIPKVTFHKPRLPDISAPQLRMPSIPVPDVSFEVPGFVATPVRRLDELLSGPLLPPGSRVVVADLSTAEGVDSELGRAVALALELELAQARYFSVVARERTLVVTGNAQFALEAEEAVVSAPAMNCEAVIAGQIEETAEWYTVSLNVFDEAGEAVYSVTVQAPKVDLVAALSEGVDQLRQRLGESGRGADAPVSASLLSGSVPALRAFAEARAHLYNGRYYQAIAAARRATRHDGGFAAAHRVMADAYALTGQRARARDALETAWRHRVRLSERERLRLEADREALAGRYSQAISGYDRLFAVYRDDVGALKSQAILQRMIGARGHGTGNLRVAYSIDPVDWPPLRRVARFLGYRGQIPEVESLAAASGD